MRGRRTTQWWRSWWCALECGTSMEGTVTGVITAPWLIAKGRGDERVDRCVCELNNDLGDDKGSCV